MGFLTVTNELIGQVVEPEGLKVALDDLLEDFDIHVLLHATVVGAERTDGMITSVEIQDKTERRVIAAKAFVDCSGDCDLAYHAGASTRYGNNGFVNLGSLATRWGGLQNAWPTAKEWSEAVQAAKAADPTLRQKIPKDGSVLIRLPKSRDIYSFMASAIVDVRSAESLTRAEQTGRKQAQEYLKILKTLPGHENIYLVSTGPSFGTRESRHITSRKQLVEQDILEGRRFADTIAIGAWGFEWHDDSREDWASTFTYPPHGCFEIPLSCLWSADTANLWAAGRCADGDQRTGSSIRVMGTGLATGQAAGVAAALRARDGCDPAVEEVRQVLTANGALLDQDKLVPVPYVGPSDGHK